MSEPIRFNLIITYGGCNTKIQQQLVWYHHVSIYKHFCVYVCVRAHTCVLLGIKPRTSHVQVLYHLSHVPSP
jgi:hypothetical protein